MSDMACACKFFHGYWRLKKENTELRQDLKDLETLMLNMLNMEVSE